MARLPACDHLGGVAYRESEKNIASKKSREDVADSICDGELGVLKFKEEKEPRFMHLLSGPSTQRPLVTCLHVCVAANTD